MSISRGALPRQEEGDARCREGDGLAGALRLVLAPQAREGEREGAEKDGEWQGPAGFSVGVWLVTF